MEIEEKPAPMEARQRTFGPSFGQGAARCSAEMPLRSGPRHWGQSAAQAREAGSNDAARKTKASFMEGVWRSREGSQLAGMPQGLNDRFSPLFPWTELVCQIQLASVA